MSALALDAFDALSPAERILLVQDLWDRIAAAPEQVPLPQSQRDELDRRLASYEADPSTAIPWEQVKARMRSR